MIMDWITFPIFLAILCLIAKWLHNELKEAKMARIEASFERREMLKSIKNIEEQVTDLDKVLHPIEKRHFR